jgi:hypothetical protein
MTDKTQLTIVDKNYLANKANLGMESVEQEDIPTPTLLLTQDISKVVDEAGKKIPAGKFYYSGTGEVFDEVDVTLLILNKKDTADYQTKDPTRTHIYLGVLNKTKMPFLIWFKNTGLFSSREFIGKVKAMRVPMFSLNVKLSAEQTSYEKNTWWKVRFQILGSKESMEELTTLEELIHQYAPHLDAEITKADEAQQA